MASGKSSLSRSYGANATRMNRKSVRRSLVQYCTERKNKRLAVLRFIENAPSLVWLNNSSRSRDWRCDRRNFLSSGASKEEKPPDSGSLEFETQTQTRSASRETERARYEYVIPPNSWAS
jgi:hypothetical protein